MVTPVVTAAPEVLSGGPRMAVAASRAPCSSIPEITCMYVSWVNETDEWPSRSLTTLTGTPARTAAVA